KFDFSKICDKIAKLIKFETVLIKSLFCRKIKIFAEDFPFVENILEILQKTKYEKTTNVFTKAENCFYRAKYNFQKSKNFEESIKLLKKAIQFCDLSQIHFYTIKSKIFRFLAKIYLAQKEYFSYLFYLNEFFKSSFMLSKDDSIKFSAEMDFEERQVKKLLSNFPKNLVLYFFEYEKCELVFYDSFENNFFLTVTRIDVDLIGSDEYFPLVLEIPIAENTNENEMENVLKRYEQIMKENIDLTKSAPNMKTRDQKQQWWKRRKNLDNLLKQNLLDFEENVLKYSKFLLSNDFTKLFEFFH
ncbi:hypothetical protein MHBO_003138, partial [Bonamia ostreae]